MLSKEKLKQYQDMSVSQRMRLVLDMCRRSTPFLLIGTPDHIERKFQLIKRENDLRNENMLRAIAKTRSSKHDKHGRS